MIQFLKTLFIRLWAKFSKRKRTELELDEINIRLQIALNKQKREKHRLKRQIIRHFNRYGFGQSKFIRRRGRSNFEIQQECKLKFGEQMEKVNLKLNNNLEFE